MILIILLILALAILLFAIYLEAKIGKDTEAMMKDQEEEIEDIKYRVEFLEVQMRKACDQDE